MQWRCWLLVSAAHVAANQCQAAWETGQLSMTWLRVASCSWQAACGQRCDSGVPLWMCLWKAPTKSLPCSRRQTTTRPGLGVVLCRTGTMQRIVIPAPV